MFIMRFSCIVLGNEFRLFIVGGEGLVILEFSWILLLNWCLIWRVCSNVVIIRNDGVDLVIIIVVINHSCNLRNQSCKGRIGISNRVSVTVLGGDRGGLALSLANTVDAGNYLHWHGKCSPFSSGNEFLCGKVVELVASL